MVSASELIDFLVFVIAVTVIIFVIGINVLAVIGWSTVTVINLITGRDTGYDYFDYVITGLAIIVVAGLVAIARCSIIVKTE